MVTVPIGLILWIIGVFYVMDSVKIFMQVFTPSLQAEIKDKFSLFNDCVDKYTNVDVLVIS